MGISLGLSFVTGGLSALLGAAEIAAMRQLVKKIVDEAADRIVEELLARVTEPVNAKLEAMVEDMVLDLAEGAFSMPAFDGAGGTRSRRRHATGLRGRRQQRRLGRRRRQEDPHSAGRCRLHGDVSSVAAVKALRQAEPQLSLLAAVQLQKEAVAHPE